MKAWLLCATLIASAWIGPGAVYAQDPTSAPVAKAEFHLQVEQPAPTPSVIHSESSQQSSVTKIVETAPPDSSTNGIYLLVGVGVAAAMGLGLYSVSKRN